MYKVFRLWLDGKIHASYINHGCPDCGGELKDNFLDGFLACNEGCGFKDSIIQTHQLRMTWHGMHKYQKLDALAIPKGYRVNTNHGFVNVIDRDSNVVYQIHPLASWEFIMEWLIKRPYINLDEVPAIAALDVRVLR